MPRVSEGVGMLKIGLELFVSEGPPCVALGAEAGLPVFLDLKLHDIPETVDRAVARAAALGVRYLTVHAQGGADMLARAAARAQREGGLDVVAVTVLTSLDARDLRTAGVEGTPREAALRLARVARDAGVGAFVCSAEEVAAMRGEVGREAVIFTPGIRLPDDPASDQRRVASPGRAIADGASWLVVGRPIRDAADPLETCRAIARAIAEARA